jgi:integrase
MKATVKFLARVADRNGKFPFIDVPINKKGRPEPVENVTQYYARYTENGSRIVKPLGTDIALAHIVFQNIELNHQRVRAGLAPLTELYKDFKANAPNDPNVPRVRVLDAATEYLTALPTLDKSPATIAAYRNTLNGFAESCSKTYIDQINRKDIIDYIAWMRNNLQKRVYGEQNRTIRNRLTYLGTFLAQNGVTLKKPKGNPNAEGLLFFNDLPKYTKRAPDKYSIETINKLLAVADKKEHFLIEFFLYTGCRDEEVAHMEWSDFDGKSIRVQPKPHYGWRVKDREVRNIDLLPSKFVKKMIAYRDGRVGADKKCNLIFPSSVRRPDKHLVKIIQRVAVRAGLEGRFTLHKLRRTFGSMVARKFGLATAMRLMGQADLQTTARYLAQEDIDSVAQKSIDQLFEGVIRKR